MDKLPIWATVGRAYGFAFGNLGLLVRGLWIWFVLFAVLSITVWTLWAFQLRTLKELSPFTQIGISTAVTVILNTIGTIPVAMFAHRAILLGHRPSSWFTISLGLRDLRYAGILALAIVYVGIVALVSFFIGLVTGGKSVMIMTSLVGHLSVISATMFVATTAASLILVRLAIKLPAVAVDDLDTTMVLSWRLTDGNTWRLWFCGALSVSPYLIGSWIINRITFAAIPLNSITIAASLFFIGTVLLFLTVVVWAGFLSHAYRHFVPETAESGAGAPAGPIA